ncbi:MAG: helix-turn-helix domain-containing protein [Clostridiaceae bacterium]|nr:helix-turn-helix domain-containing protein [Clostridiaceae bacterium]
MDMTTHYAHIIENYPEYINRKQLIEICGICPSTAYKWEQKEYVTFTREVCTSGSYNKFRLLDVLQYLYKRDCHQDAGSHYVRAMRRFYENELSEYPDAMGVENVIEFTGFSKSAITNWVRQKKLDAIKAKKKYYFPKEYLIDFLISSYYRQITRSSKKRQLMVQKFEEYYDISMHGGEC